MTAGGLVSLSRLRVGDHFSFGRTDYRVTSTDTDLAGAITTVTVVRLQSAVRDRERLRLRVTRAEDVMVNRIG